MEGVRAQRPAECAGELSRNRFQEMQMSFTKLGAMILAISLSGCAAPVPVTPSQPAVSASVRSSTPAERLARYTSVGLVADESSLTAKERQMLPLLIDAAR